MKIKIAIIAAIVLVATTVTLVKTNKDTAPLLEANVDALSFNEGEMGLRNGHHSEVCGALVIAWNGKPTNCTQYVVRCDWVNKNDCVNSGCPNHG